MVGGGGGKPNLVISDELIKNVAENNWSVVYLSLEYVLHLQSSGHN